MTLDLVALRENVEVDGFCVVEALVTPREVGALLEALHESSVVVTRSRGVRNLASKVPLVASLAASPPVRAVAETLLGPSSRLVRSILFDKVEGANWNMRWHQDVTVAVEDRREVAGYGPWSVKEGVDSVQAPAPVLERIISVRVHLDPCDERNGALRVLPGSHRFGKLGPERGRHLTQECPPHVCATGAGGAVIMRPLLLHSSGPSERPSHRRVVHLDFATGDLDGGLEWSRLA